MFVIMSQVKPNKIRYHYSFPRKWVFNGSTDKERPYRKLIKEI